MYKRLRNNEMVLMVKLCLRKQVYDWLSDVFYLIQKQINKGMEAHMSSSCTKQVRNIVFVYQQY